MKRMKYEEAKRALNDLGGAPRTNYRYAFAPVILYLSSKNLIDFVYKLVLT